MLRAIPRMATAVAHDAGPRASSAGNPSWPWCRATPASHWQPGRMAEARLAGGAARGGRTRPPRPQLAVGMIVTSGSGMESEP
jgi:hypothetical protein